MEFNKVDYLEIISLGLVIIGALNWGLIGLTDLSRSSINLVSMTLGQINPTLENITYILVGLAGLYQFYFSYQFYGKE